AAPPSDGVGNCRVQKAQVKGQAFLRRGPVESDVIGNRGVAVTQAGDKTEDVVAAPRDGATKILPGCAGQRRQIRLAKSDQPDRRVAVDGEVEFVQSPGV